MPLDALWPRLDHRLDRALGILVGWAVGEAAARARGGGLTEAMAAVARPAAAGTDAVAAAARAGAASGPLCRVPVLALARVEDGDRLAADVRTATGHPAAASSTVDACLVFASVLRGAVQLGGPGGALSGVHDALARLPLSRRAAWADLATAPGVGARARYGARGVAPRRRGADGGAAAAVRAGLAAVLRTPVPAHAPGRGVFRCDHVADALAAVLPRPGSRGDPAGDTRAGGREVRGTAGTGDALAGAVTGALLGACWGVSGIPLDCQRGLTAAGLRARDLVALAALTLCGGRPDADGWPTSPSMVHAVHAGPAWAVPHPLDAGVVMSNLAYVAGAGGFDAVVSLCRVGAADLPAGLGEEHRAMVWMVDTPGANPNLHFVVDQAARAIASFRDQDKRVLVHCAFGRSRTPAVTARYAALRLGVDTPYALRTTLAAVDGHMKNPELANATSELGATPR